MAATPVVSVAHISIHALRKESDTCSIKPTSETRNFNPRSP